MIIYVAAIEHMTGMDLHTALSEEALEVKVATYCRSRWETIPWKGEAPPDIPETDAAVIGLYFSAHEDDSLTTGIDSVEDANPTVLPLPSVKSLAHPDAVGNAEYRALHGLLEDTGTLEEAIALCGEMESWARATAEILKLKQP